VELNLASEGTTTTVNFVSGNDTTYSLAARDGVETCLSVRYNTRGGWGEYSPQTCLTYVDDSVLVDTGTFLVLVIGMVAFWLGMNGPLVYFMYQVDIPSKMADIRSILSESVLDALELVCGFLILMAFKEDMNARDTILFIAVILSWVNIVGATIYAVNLLRTAAETLSLTSFHLFTGYHATATLFVIIPELVLETMQYVETHDATDMLGVIGLSIDLGVRLKHASTFLNNKTDPADMSQDSASADDLKGNSEYLQAQLAESEQTVASQAQELTLLRKRLTGVSNSGMFSMCSATP